MFSTCAVRNPQIKFKKYLLLKYIGIPSYHLTDYRCLWTAPQDHDNSPGGNLYLDRESTYMSSQYSVSGGKGTDMVEQAYCAISDKQ